MNEQFTRQAQEMFNAAKDARIPENFQAFQLRGEKQDKNITTTG